MGGSGGEKLYRKSLAARFYIVNGPRVPINWSGCCVHRRSPPITSFNPKVAWHYPVQAGNLHRVVRKPSGLEKRSSIDMYMLCAQLLEKNECVVISPCWMKLHAVIPWPIMCHRLLDGTRIPIFPPMNGSILSFHTFFFNVNAIFPNYFFSTFEVST